MNRLTIFVFLIFSFKLICAQTNRIESEHFNDKYEVETESYVRAVLEYWNWHGLLLLETAIITPTRN